jgi:pyruvate dehydrogenase E1 component alpha subunit
MEEAKASPEPPMDEFWTEIYVPGTEPKVMRGVDPAELIHFK